MSAPAGAEILASCSPGEIRIAVVASGALLDYALHRPSAPDGVNDLHLGRIEAVLPALGGAFVALGGQGGGQSGFLPDDASGPERSEGALIAVRITRSPQGGKGPRLTARLSESERQRAEAHRCGQGLIARGPDVLHRLAASWPDAAIQTDDPAVSAALHADFGAPRRVATVRQAFDDSLEAAIEALASPNLALPGGLRASIHPTPALVAIDVDGGGSSAERGPKQTVQFAANRAAIPPLLHQVRLRNLSGAILLDLAGLSLRKRQALLPDIEAALLNDPLRPRLLGFTALGLAEILRPRVHPPLHELLGNPLGAGLAGLRAALASRSTTLRGGIDVITALRAEPAALADFAQRAARPISLRMDPALLPLAWSAEND